MIGPITGGGGRSGYPPVISKMIGDGTASSGTDNAATFQAEVLAAAASESRALLIPAVLGASLTSGLLLVGRQYFITNLVAGDDFSNVGQVATYPYRFVASGTTPNVWTHGSVVQEILGTYNFGSVVDIPPGIAIEGIAPGDIGGPAPWQAVPFPVRLVCTALNGTALRLAQAASSQFKNIELAGNSDTGLQVGRTMLVNSATTNNSATVTVSGVTAFAFAVGLAVIGTGIPAATTVNTSITSGSATATVSSATGLSSGMAVSGTGIPLGATMTISGTTITLSANATATNGTASLTFTPAVTAVSGAPVRTACLINSTTTLTVTGSTSGLVNGMTVIGDGIQYGTTMTISGSVVTLSKTAINTTTGIYTFRSAAQTVTLSNAATATNTLTDTNGLTFVDEHFQDTNYILQPGSNVSLDYCFIHGFGCNITSNDVVVLRLNNCVLLNAQLAEARCDNVICFAWRNVQAGGDGEFTPSIGFSFVEHQASTGVTLEDISLFNCSTAIDVGSGVLNCTDLNFQGFIGSGVGIDARGGSFLFINGWSFAAMNGTCVGMKLHDAEAVVCNVGAGPSATLSGVTHASTTVDVVSAGLLAGMAVTGSNISAGTWISAIPDSTHVTLNQAATSSATLNLTFTPAAVQTTFDNKLRVLVPDPNGYKQIIDGSGNVTAQYALADSASLINSGDLQLAYGSLLGVTGANGFFGIVTDGAGGVLRVFAGGNIAMTVSPNGYVSLPESGSGILLTKFGAISGPSGQQFQIGDFGLLNLIDTNGTTQAHVFTDGFHVDQGKLFIPSIPTSDPHVAGQMWSNLGIATISSG